MKQNILMGNYSEDVDVHFWLPEMNGVNVTILCDRLIQKYGDGVILLVTDRGDMNCLSMLNIVEQSSGFKLSGQAGDEKFDIVKLETDESCVKDWLTIPDDPWCGFSWGNKHLDKPVPSHMVPTSKFDSRYILNFSVSGEFNLGICYVPKRTGEQICLFEKSFSCK